MAAEEVPEDWKIVSTITTDKRLFCADPEVGLDDPCVLLPAQNILWFCGDSKSQIALRPHVQNMQTLKCGVLICH